MTLQHLGKLYQKGCLVCKHEHKRHQIAALLWQIGDCGACSCLKKDHKSISREDHLEGCLLEAAELLLIPYPKEFGQYLFIKDTPLEKLTADELSDYFNKWLSLLLRESVK